MSLPAQPFSPPVGPRWLKANVVSAIIAAVASLAIYGARNITGTTAGADVSAVAIAIQYVAAAGFSLLAGAADGLLTGAVLQRILPLLPARTWIALHAAIALVFGLWSEIPMRSPAAPPTTEITPAAMLVVGFFGGAFLGAAVGGLEALVLRKAAHDTKTWIAWSALANAVVIGVVGASVGQWGAGEGIAGALASVAIGFAMSVGTAVLMVPAVLQLRPLQFR